MVWLSVALAMQKLNWNGPEWTVLTGRAGKHRFEARFQQENFRWRGRLRGAVRHGESYVPAANGRPFWGYDGWPKADVAKLEAEMEKNNTVVRSISGRIDDWQFSVPTRLVDDLLNPDFNQPEHPNVGYEEALLSKDGHTLWLKLSGSDGGGGYVFFYTIRKHGRITRARVEADQYIARGAIPRWLYHKPAKTRTS